MISEPLDVPVVPKQVPLYSAKDWGNFALLGRAMLAISGTSLWQYATIVYTLFR